MNIFKKLYWTFKIHIFLKTLKFKINRQYTTSPKCYLFLAADYGNLGDVAITYAQKQFLTAKFPNYEIEEVCAAQTLSKISQIRKCISVKDIVTVIGGGNMGDMYGDIELLRLLVVKNFPNNRIILFPQTIDYSDSRCACWLMSLSKKIYNSHSNLLMTAREKISYDRMKKYYPKVDVRLTPDIVMSLNKSTSCSPRRAIVTLCLRDDKEKFDNSDILRKIERIIKKSGLSIERYDTHIGSGRFTEERKYSELKKIWQQFSQSKLVVTDRLHGMIFAYITGTPALVLPNSNFKIQGCYQWIKDCGYIHFYSNESDIIDVDSFLSSGVNFNPEVHQAILQNLDKLL